VSVDNAELTVGIFTLAVIVIALWLAALDKRVSELMAWRFERDAERLRALEERRLRGPRY
jgi:hypothetical protein